MAYAQIGEKESAWKALRPAVNSPAMYQGEDDARKTLGDLK